MSDFLELDLLFEKYENYREQSLTHRRFKHADLLPIFNFHGSNNIIELEEAGKSFEERKIFLARFGNGKTKILCWSQMHGDEPTATAAIFDIFNFLSGHDKFNSLREKLKSELTIYFVPMLNPDGAERFQRRNAMQIDLNRDALRFESPESKILKNIIDRIKPEFGFNLHDQHSRYSVGRSGKGAAISFLAPAFDFGKEINPVRKKAMQLIGCLSETLEKYIPGNIAKYDDEFEPRAYGDNVTRWGTSTVLIESGGWPGDPEKQFLRKINFMALIKAFELIADSSFLNTDISDYKKIPENKELFFDLLLKNIGVNINGHDFQTDIGINLIEKNNIEITGSVYEGIIEEIGDLSTYFGHKELDCSGLTLALSPTEKIEIKNPGTGQIESFNFEPEAPANFMLMRDKIPVYFVVNGFLKNLHSETFARKNDSNFE